MTDNLRTMISNDMRAILVNRGYDNFPADEALFDELIHELTETTIDFITHADSISDFDV